MRRPGLRGAVRGKRYKTATPVLAAARPLNLVERQFRATLPEQ